MAYDISYYVFISACNLAFEMTSDHIVVVEATTVMAEVVAVVGGIEVVEDLQECNHGCIDLVIVEFQKVDKYFAFRPVDTLRTVKYSPGLMVIRTVEQFL